MLPGLARVLRRLALPVVGVGLLLASAPVVQEAPASAASGPTDLTVSPEVYPHPDGVADTAVLRLVKHAEFGEAAGAHGTVKNAAKQVVGKPIVLTKEFLAPASVTFTWSPRDLAGKVLPDGAYHVTLQVDYTNGGLTLFGRDFVIRSGVLLHKTWRRTVRPRASAIHRDMGNCTAIKSPARPGWRGSFGYRTSRCRDSVAVTVHQVKVPSLPVSVKGHTSRYAGARIVLNGRAGRGAPGSKLIYSYFLRRGEYQGRARWFGPGPGDHSGVRVPGKGAIVPDRGRNRFIWLMGTGYGMKYDVRSVTVVVRYSWYG